MCEYKNKNELLVHEMCHLALYNLTKQNSMKEEFRFFDEGFAEIMGRQIGEPNELNEYKKQSIQKAKKELKNKGISFQKVQKWNKFFGDFNNANAKLDWSAYDVGASFVFFILDTYSKDKLYDFFVSVSKTSNLAKSILEVFSKKESEFEVEWKNYILKKSKK